MQNEVSIMDVPFATFMMAEKFTSPDRQDINRVYFDPKRRFVEAMDGVAWVRLSTRSLETDEAPMSINRSTLLRIKKFVTRADQITMVASGDTVMLRISGVNAWADFRVGRKGDLNAAAERWPATDERIAEIRNKGTIEADFIIAPDYMNWLNQLAKLNGAVGVKMSPRSDHGPIDIAMMSDRGATSVQALVMPMIIPEGGQ